MKYEAERPQGGTVARDALSLAFVGIAYFLAHELAFLLPGAQKVVAAVWPAAGIGLAALLLNPRRRWPAILLILFLAGNSANFLSGTPVPSSLGFVTANATESLACAWLISRWCGEVVRFSRVKQVLALIGCAAGVNAGTAFIGAGVATLAHATPFWDTWQTWYVADGLGILLIAPLVVTWSDYREWFRGLRGGRALESGVFLVAWCAAGWLIFQPVGTFHPLNPQPYMLVGLLAWPALRLGRRYVSLAVVELGVIMAVRAGSAGPLLWSGAIPVDRLLAAQVWLGFTAAVGLLLAAACTETQAAERRSRDEHDRLRALGDNLPNGVVYQLLRERDGSVRFLYVSAGVKQLTGVSVGEVLNSPSALYDLIVEEDRQAHALAEEVCGREQKVFNTEVRLRRRDGQVRWMHLSSTPRPLPDGRVLWDGIQLDVTDRKRQEAAREESEGRFRLVVENAEMPVVITSIEDGKVLFINECAARYFDTPQTEAPGLQAPDFWRDPAARARFIEVLSDTGRVAGLEVEIKTRTGQRRFASISANVISYCGQRAVFVVLNDITVIREAAAKLEHERALLRTLIETVPDMIWMKDAAGRFVTCNSATQRFFGVAESAMIGKTDYDFFPKAEAENYREQDRATIAAGGPRVNQEWVTVRETGRRVLLETTKVPTFDAGGELTGVVGVARDVTAAHMVAEALRGRVALQEQLEQLAAAAPGALISCLHRPDGTWCLTYGSPAFEDLFGVASGEFAEDATGFWTQLLHAEDRDRLSRAVSAAERNGSLLHQEFRLLNPRKGEMWMETRAVPAAQPDGGTRWQGFVMDISGRKIAEAALAEEVVRRRILFEQAHDGIAVLDLNGKLQESNPAFARMLGYTQEQTRDLYLWDWNAQWTRQELLSRLTDLATTPATFETRHRRRDGSLYEAEVSASGAEFGGNGFIYCVLRDITGRKAAEAALRESRRLEGIGVLAAGMAHEFNNLLTVINGYSGMLSSSLDLHDPMREQAEAIRGAGERAARLTRQLLTYGRKQILRPSALDLNLVVERSRGAWVPLLRPDIRLSVQLDPSAGLASIDAEQFREVLVNLVKNAVEAMPRGGQLAIATAHLRIGEEDAARHADARPGSYVMLSVSDTGVGMNERTRSRVFDPFFTTRDRATSTGLGLATVYGSVAQHKGWIAVESALGQGSEFRVYLPRVEEPDEF
jgi:PAS domain S-box-containing protein